MGRESRHASSKGKEVQTAKDKGKGKMVAKPKRKETVPRSFSAPLVIDEERSTRRRARSPTKSSSESATETDQSEHEAENVHKEKEVIPPKTYLDALKKCKVVQTRWADVELLNKLGILDDVRTVLRGMGLERLVEMDHDCFPRQVLALISSFELHFTRDPNHPSQLGYVSFEVNRRSYTLRFDEICDAYGFPQRMGKKIEAKEHQDRKVWSMIGKGGYIPGKTKSKRISHPAVRYVHKILANTIFARLETDRIIEDEMALLSNGIKSIFGLEFAGRRIDGYEDVNLGVILARRIMYTKAWALKEDRNKSTLHIGGFLTPLLEAANVPLSHPVTGPRLRLDFATLRRMNFVEGKDGEKVVYTFIGSNLATHKMILPNEPMTRLVSLDNMSFVSGEFCTFQDVDPIAALLSMREEDRDEPRSSRSEIPLGSPRYYYPPYSGNVRGKPLEHAFEGLKRSNKWNKWNSRSIHNIKRSCKKKVKALEEQLAGFRSLIETYVFRKKSPPRAADGEYDFDLAMEEARRHSISHPPTSSSSMAFDAPRSSAHQPHQRRRRLRHVRTPSPPSSDNQSLHLTSTDPEDST